MTKFDKRLYNFSPHNLVIFHLFATECFTSLNVSEITLYINTIHGMLVNEMS